MQIHHMPFDRCEVQTTGSRVIIALYRRHAAIRVSEVFLSPGEAAALSAALDKAVRPAPAPNGSAAKPAPGSEAHAPAELAAVEESA